MNPEPATRYHLVAVGAGAGGLVSVAIAAALGARVALVERHLLGGDCLNVGCVPSKGVIAAARAWRAARRASEEFGGPPVAGAGDFGRAMERMRRLRAAISPVDSVRRFTELGVDVFLGQGVFTSPGSIEVDGRRLEFRRAIIATGGRPAVPQVPGLEETGYLTNETVFTLTELPARLLVVGAGPIGCELAQAFARLGSRVTVLDRAERILPREDEDAAAIVQRAMEADGVEYLGGTTLTGAERRGSDRVLRYERAGVAGEAAGDQVLVAVGRRPNTGGLGLDAAGVEHDERGVRVDDFLRTSSPAIYAVGDVCSRYQFTHAADAMAQIAVQNALIFGKKTLGLGRKRMSSLILPWSTYTSPEIAHVGLYAREAEEAGHAVDTITVPLAENDRAVLDGESEGLFRVHLKKGGDRILGATLVAAHAGDLIGEVAVAMRNGIGLRGIGATIHPYPTQAEVFRRAAGEYAKRGLTPTAKKVFAALFRIFR